MDSTDQESKNLSLGQVLFMDKVSQMIWLEPLIMTGAEKFL